ncbi:MAG: alpha/beta fold hydrolase, partial [Pseudomonadota bacterium]
VIARSRLIKHYARQWEDEPARVNLVGHSMGGLIIAGYLERVGRKAPIDKVVSLGTPFQGSLEAPVKIVTGTGSLGGPQEPASREREAARLTPALYHLLPSYRNAIRTSADDIPGNLYEVDAWQPGVIETLAEFIRLHGLKGRSSQRDRKRWARDLLADLLQTARTHRRRLNRFRLEQAGLSEDRWLCLIGVDAKTRVQMHVERSGKDPLFKIQSRDRMNLWAEKDPLKQRLTGDGTVPYRGAEPKFLDRRKLVCLRPDDFGYWEVRDRALTSASGFHGMLPNLNLAHRLIVSHFMGYARKGTWGRPAPGIAVEDWRPPIEGLSIGD